MWQLRKLSYTAARKPLIHNRDATEPSLQKVQASWLAEIEDSMHTEQVKAQKAMEGALFPFKTLPAVLDWMLQYVPENYG